MRTLSLLIVLIGLTLVSVTWAADHVMVEPKDLKWEDVSALPLGPKVCVHCRTKDIFRQIRAHIFSTIYVENYISKCD